MRKEKTRKTYHGKDGRQVSIFRLCDWDPSAQPLGSWRTVAMYTHVNIMITMVITIYIYICVYVYTYIYMYDPSAHPLGSWRAVLHSCVYILYRRTGWDKTGQVRSLHKSKFPPDALVHVENSERTTGYSENCSNLIRVIMFVACRGPGYSAGGPGGGSLDISNSSGLPLILLLQKPPPGAPTPPPGTQPTAKIMTIARVHIPTFRISERRTKIGKSWKDKNQNR